MLLTARARFWLLWVFANTLTMGLSFGGATWWYIRFSGRPNPYVLYLALPIDFIELVLIFLTLCLVQIPFLQRLRLPFLQRPQWRKWSVLLIFIWWSLGTLIGQEVTIFIGQILAFLYVLFDQATTIRSDFSVGAMAGTLGGFVGGALMGAIQCWLMTRRLLWIAVSAVAWSASWAVSWGVMRYISLTTYYGSMTIPEWAGMSYNEQKHLYGKLMEPQGFSLELPYELLIYGAVLGFVSSAITGIGLLICLPRRDR